MAYTLCNLADTARTLGDYAMAEAQFAESLTLLQELGDKNGVAACLEGLAETAGAQGQPERCARLFGAAEALREVIGTVLTPPERADYDRAIMSARAALGDAAFQAAWTVGQSLSLEQAVASALEMS